MSKKISLAPALEAFRLMKRVPKNEAEDFKKKYTEALAQMGIVADMNGDVEVDALIRFARERGMKI